MMKWLCALMALLCLALCSCGYHTSGKADLLPTDVQTIAIPGFQNQTRTYKIDQLLTQAVVHEFVGRTHYRITNTTGHGADANLKGTVTYCYVYPVTFDTATLRVATVEVVIGASVTLTDRDGRVLYSNPNYSFRDQYELARDVATFFQEESPALDRMSRDFARTLVSNILEGY
ncbi:MAG TPA: LptE family protein [Terriglobales bacterium]|nr:LptE family protein [Terriglobales bacterium]